MATTKDEIRNWFQDGVKNGYKYMIIACDTFDHEDYPVYCKSEQEFEKEYPNYYFVNMQKVMETYDLTLDMEEQVNKGRNHIPLEVKLQNFLLTPNVKLYQ